MNADKNHSVWILMKMKQMVNFCLSRNFQVESRSRSRRVKSRVNRVVNKMSSGIFNIISY